MHHLREVWGLEALQPSEQLNVDNDSLLVLRLMFLISLMKMHTLEPTASFVGRPQDPMECVTLPLHIGVHLFGQQRSSRHGSQQWVIIWSNLTNAVWGNWWRRPPQYLQTWTFGLRCNRHPHILPEDMKSSDLSRYPPHMMIGLAGAISKKLRDVGQTTSGPTISWESNGSVTPRVVHRDPGSDRPSSLPLTHRVSLMHENLVVQLGFRTRPLRDGGGKPSPGRLPPPLRKTSHMAPLGAKIQKLTEPISQAVRMSISCGEKHHPFLDVLLNQIRDILGATPGDQVLTGQPFFLTLISRLVKEAGDPDCYKRGYAWEWRSPP